MAFPKKNVIRVKNLSRTQKNSSDEQDNDSTSQADSAGKAKVPPSKTSLKGFAQGKNNASSSTSVPQTDRIAHKLVSISSLLKNSPQTDAAAHKLVSIDSLLKNSAQMNVCLKHKGPHLKKGLMSTCSFDCKGVSSNTQADPTNSTVIRRTSSASILDKNSMIPRPTTSSGGVVNKGFQITPTLSDKDKGMKASPPPSSSTNMCTAVAPAGVYAGRSSEFDLQPGTATSRSPAKKTLTGCTTESNCVREDEDHRKKNANTILRALLPPPQTDTTAHKLVSISTLLKNSSQTDASAHKLVSIDTLLKNSAQMNVCLKHKGHHLEKGLMSACSFNCKGVSSNTQADPTSSTFIRRTSSAPIMYKNSMIPHPTKSSDRVVDQDFQMTPTLYDKDKGVEASPLPSTSTNICTAVAPARGRSSEIDPQPGTATGRSPAKKNLIGCTTESTCVRGDDGYRKKNVPKNDNHSESEVSRITNLDRKSTRTSSEVKPKHHIRWKGVLYLFADTPLMPPGERCPLCNNDLAFSPNGCDSPSDVVLCSAASPCGHSYHDCCIQDVFGPCEPVHRLFNCNELKLLHIRMNDFK